MSAGLCLIWECTRTGTICVVLADDDSLGQIIIRNNYHRSRMEGGGEGERKERDRTGEEEHQSACLTGDTLSA